ncbi:MAG: CTAG/PCC1 family protein [Candidatus Thermoplasmatota archaeon]|jgi:tRNA threonylcarbamoyladenosine modification (KEOPS) complex  Pcc1 subunit|nr:CTAG/PCC1 family protein [Candidatus Thermoplasmatota archaeon]MCL5955771.1 CTAG/PCC1 family protein [Candidatus Thermoplasmatota archaeon]
MKFEVAIRLEKSRYEDFVKAIKPDISQTVGRSRARISEDADFFYIYISSPDTVALRAAVGSLTRWFKVIKDIMEEIE